MDQAVTIAIAGASGAILKSVLDFAVGFFKADKDCEDREREAIIKDGSSLREELRAENRELKKEVDQLRSLIRTLQAEVDRLQRVVAEYTGDRSGIQDEPYPGEGSIKVSCETQGS